MDRQPLLRKEAMLFGFYDELGQIRAGSAMEKLAGTGLDLDALVKLAEVDEEIYELLKQAGLFSRMGRAAAKLTAGAKHSGPVKAVRRLSRRIRTGPSTPGRLTPKARAAARKMSGTGAPAPSVPTVAGTNFAKTGPTRQAFQASNREIAKATGKMDTLTDAAMGNKGVRQQVASRRQQLDSFLQRTGRTSKGVPGLEQKLQSIPGHSGQLTRTPARVVQQGTVAASPRAITASRGAAAGTVAAPAPRAGTSVGTVAGRPGKVRNLRQAGTAQTVAAPLSAYGNTVRAPAAAYA